MGPAYTNWRRRRPSYRDEDLDAPRPAEPARSAPGVPLFLQKKLAISPPGDAFEQEADRTAEAVMSGGFGFPTLQAGAPAIGRKCSCGSSSSGKCEECKQQREEELPETARFQRRPDASGTNSGSGGSDKNFAPPIVHEALRSSGSPLDTSVRPMMESRFGRDFGDVRVHMDSLAAKSAQAVNAVAYTAGKDVVFAPGQYSPASSAGQQLLAHELAHVVQQERAPTAVHRQFSWNPGEDDHLGDDPSPDDMYSWYFSLVARRGIDKCAEALAKRLHIYLARHSNPYDFIGKLFHIIPSDYEDNVASNFVADFDELGLIHFAANDAGHETLDMLYEAMMTGDVSGFERQQAARLEQFGITASRQRQVLWSMTAVTSRESAQSAVEGFEGEVEDDDLDDAAEHLARKLRGYVDAHPDPYAYLSEVFRLLPDAREDNVAAEFVATMDNATLEAFGKPEAAQDLLNTLYEALITGDVSGFERFEAERILRLKTARTPLAEYEVYQQHRLIFPVKYQKFFRDCYAPLSAELLPGGKVRAWYGTVRIWQCDEFKVDRATLGVPDTQLVDRGIVLKADEIVTVKLYDEDERELDIPALGLIDYANESKNRTVSLAGQAFLAGLTLPIGGAAETAFGRALLIADRVAWGISVVSSLINDNRDWIASLPGGQVLLDAIDSVNRLAGYYGWARLGGEALHFAAGKLGPAWREWHGQPKLGLTGDQAGIVEELDRQTESIVNDLEGADREAHATASKAASTAAAPKSWEDFLPEAQERVTAAKAKYGDHLTMSASADAQLMVTAQSVGMTAEDLTNLRAGERVMPDMVVGSTKAVLYYDLEGEKLTGGILSIKGDVLTEAGKWESIRAFMRFKNQSMELAGQLGAKVLRIEGAAVHNDKIIELLRAQGFEPIQGTASNFYLEMPVR